MIPIIAVEEGRSIATLKDFANIARIFANRKSFN
jgi:hypothetical protein